MWNVIVQKFLQVIFIMTATGYAALSSADDEGAVMDPSGSVPGFTGYAEVTCFDSGDGLPDYLEASIKDTSPPQGNLLVNLQIIKGNSAISTTDPVPGDANFSPVVSVHEGGGVYLLLVNKTGAGARSFLVSYHCKTASGIHTGTGIFVNQFR